VALLGVKTGTFRGKKWHILIVKLADKTEKVADKNRKVADKNGMVTDLHRHLYRHLHRHR
jgi:hypothetical protein